jgi:hypothetical protein
MQLLPMDMPAEIHRRTMTGPVGGAIDGHVVVAKGPFIIMAHGLLSIDPAEREGLWITSPLGDLSAEEAEEALRQWSEACGHAGRP